MQSYIIRRLIQSALVLLIISILVFLIMRMLPGDPLSIHLSDQSVKALDPKQIAELKHTYGLDQPLPMQYISWISGVFHGDLGHSLVFTNESVLGLIWKRLPISFHLGFVALLLSCILGIMAGVICAVRRGKWLDTLVTMIANLGVTVPPFWLGVILILIFGLQFDWLPIQGYTSPIEDFWLNTRQVIMPIICLAIFPVASVARQTRSSMLDVIHQDYIRTAWSGGLSEKRVIIRHSLKNGLIPVVTLIGTQVRHIFGGSILIESIFNIPGMGRMMIEAIFTRDYSVVQGGILVIAVVVVLVNLIIDISYGWIDPRIRYD